MYVSGYCNRCGEALLKSKCTRFKCSKPCRSEFCNGMFEADKHHDKCPCNPVNQPAVPHPLTSGNASGHRARYAAEPDSDDEARRVEPTTRRRDDDARQPHRQPRFYRACPNACATHADALMHEPTHTPPTPPTPTHTTPPRQPNGCRGTTSATVPS